MNEGPLKTYHVTRGVYFNCYSHLEVESRVPDCYGAWNLLHVLITMYLMVVAWLTLSHGVILRDLVSNRTNFCLFQVPKWITL